MLAKPNTSQHIIIFLEIRTSYYKTIIDSLSEIIYVINTISHYISLDLQKIN